jgi:hypothetical protein
MPASLSASGSSEQTIGAHCPDQDTPVEELAGDYDRPAMGMRCGQSYHIPLARRGLV